LILILIVFAILSVIILRWPYLGIVITLASLPLTDILPSVPGASSMFSLLGGVTLVGFLMTGLVKKAQQTPFFKVSASLIWGFLFLLWLLTNFSSAITPDTDGRIWIFTYLQLWMLAWLASLLLNTPERVHILMWGFFLACLVSAIYAGTEGFVGLTVKTSVRTDGLAAGVNSAARYFLIALICGYSLFVQQKKRWLQIFFVAGMIILLYGVFVTVSRTGLLLLVGGIGLLLLQNLGTKNKSYIFVFAFCALALVWFFADNVVAIFQSISGSILAGTDTVGIRYGLWQAGFRMWTDYPIFGVGVGQFSTLLPLYAWDLLQPRYLALGPHNMYIGILSETGLVGLVFFVTMFVISLRALFQKTNSSNLKVQELARNWMIIFALIVLAGITKHDQYDKLTWIVLGVSAAINQMDI